MESQAASPARVPWAEAERPKNWPEITLLMDELSRCYIAFVERSSLGSTFHCVENEYRRVDIIYRGRKFPLGRRWHIDFRMHNDHIMARTCLPMTSCDKSAILAWLNLEAVEKVESILEACSSGEDESSRQGRRFVTPGGKPGTKMPED